MKNLRKAGGISALLCAATYVFAIGLYLTTMMPLSDPGLGLDGYMAFLIGHRSLAFIWNFSMYIIHAACLVVLILALYERLKTAAPRLGLVASAFGLIWASFVFLSGFINLWGNEALIALFEKSPAQAESFKNSLTIITLGIDSSDRLLGSLWLGMVSLAALRKGLLPKALAILGMALGGLALILGLVLPTNDSSASFLFGVGAVLWWLILGVFLLGKRAEA